MEKLTPMPLFAGVSLTAEDGELSRCAFAGVWLAYSVLIVAFSLLHPLWEWPDAPIHLADACSGKDIYVPVPFLDAFGQHACGTFYFEKSSFSYFADRLIFWGDGDLNPLWLYGVFPLFLFQLTAILISASGGRDLVGNQLILAPPLAFCVSNINQEVLGLWLVLIAYYNLGKRDVLAFLLVFTAFLIDRSHICSLATFAVIKVVVPRRSHYLLTIFVLVVLTLYVARLSGALNIVDVIALLLGQGEVAGISAADIYSNADMGRRGYAALLSSVAGLYGAMSIRPLAWQIYYAAFFGCFLVGFFCCEGREKRLFMASFFCALSVLLILPPLSQARYYPILIISMWTIALRGWRRLGGRADVAALLCAAWTILTLLLVDARLLVS